MENCVHLNQTINLQSTLFDKAGVAKVCKGPNLLCQVQVSGRHVAWASTDLSTS